MSLPYQISLDAIGSSVDKSSRSMIRFETDVDWRERHRFLKCEFIHSFFSFGVPSDDYFPVSRAARQHPRQRRDV